MDKDYNVSKTSSKKTTNSKSKSASKLPPKKKAVAKKKLRVAKKAVTKKAVVKKPLAKKNVTSTKKVSVKKSTVKKTPAKKSTAKKSPVKSKKVPSKKVPIKKVSSKVVAIKKTPARKVAPKRTPFKKIQPQLSKTARGKALNKRELKKFEKILLELRLRLQGDIRFLTTDNLHRAGRETGADLSGSAQHSADHGTDNFDREFALSLASTEQDVLYEVDEALMRIDDGGYGVCEMSGVQIERARLEVIPYTRYSVQAQSKMEQGHAKYRPFAQTFKGW